MRPEVDPHGVDVVLVEPGPVETNFGERWNEELDRGTESSGAYDAIYDFHEDQRTLGGKDAVAVLPEDVAETVLEAAVSPDPKARYPVGRSARLMLLSRFVPDTARDAFYRVLRRFT